MNYCCIFKTTTLVCKFLHSGSPSYFEPPFSLSSCSYSTRHSHLDHQYLFLLSTPHSTSQSNTLAIVLRLMLPRFGMIFLMMHAVQHLLLPPGMGSKLTCLQKPICHSLHVTPVSSWYDLVLLMDLWLFTLVSFSRALESVT